MIRSHKVLAVARFELLSVLRTKGYLIATFGMPVFLALYGLLASVPAYFAQRSSRDVPRSHGVIDTSGVLGFGAALEPVRAAAVDTPGAAQVAVELAGERARLVRDALAPVTFVPYADLAAAQTAFDQGTIASYYHLEADYTATGKVRHYRGDRVNLNSEVVHAAFTRLLRQRLLAGHLPAELIVRVERPIAERETWMVDARGTVRRFDLMATVMRYAVPGVMSVLLFVSLMMGTSYLVSGMAIEKQNRVVEVLLSALDPDELLFGKLLGLGGAGLLQVGVWFSMLLLGGAVLTATLAFTGVAMPWLLIAAGVPYFVLTYLLFGSLMLATSALGGSLRESQQLAGMWTLLAVAPMILMSGMIGAPNGALARVLSYIPFTACVTLLMRLTLEPQGVPWPDLVVPLLLLVLGIWIAIRLGARLFRVGLLLTGSRPRWRELWRQARLGP